VLGQSAAFPTYRNSEHHCLDKTLRFTAKCLFELPKHAERLILMETGSACSTDKNTYLLLWQQEEDAKGIR